MNTIKNTVVNYCARCHQNHKGLDFKMFLHPIVDDNEEIEWTHWTTCPNSGDPILLRVTNEFTEVYD